MRRIARVVGPRFIGGLGGAAGEECAPGQAAPAQLLGDKDKYYVPGTPMAVAFDWCYGGFSPEERREFAGAVLALAAISAAEEPVLEAGEDHGDRDARQEGDEGEVLAEPAVRAAHARIIPPRPAPLN